MPGVTGDSGKERKAMTEANALCDEIRSDHESVEEGMGLSRRGAIRSVVAGLGLGALPSVAIGDTGLRASGGRRRRQRPAAPPTFGGTDPALLGLINRATMGFSRSAYDEAETMGYENWLEWQLDHENIDDSAWEAQLATYLFDTLTMTSQQIFNTYGDMDGIIIQQLVRSTILRHSFSRKQLFERMVEFWTDHFNIEILDGQCRRLKTADDRDVIRANALGTFPELLSASAHSGAMLFYLDNYTNIVGHAQENYARELMELHTMGVDGGYSQNDVEEVARCFTGWNYWGTGSGQFGNFRFLSGQHDNGPKTVLGNAINAGGVADGEAVLDILAYHPSTARFIARKLCKRFLGYSPPEDMVETVKQTYLDTGGDIKSMLRVILHPTVMQYLTTPKFKRPLHLMTSLLRATGATVTQARYVQNEALSMGQLPFYWSPPDGYPDSIEAWGTSLLPRWDFAWSAFNTSPQVTIDTVGLLNSEGGNVPGQQAAAINRILTGGTLPANEVAEIQDYYDNAPAGSALRDSFTLGSSVPGYQWY